MDKNGIAGVAICVVLLIAWYPLMHGLGWLPQGPPPGPAQSVERKAIPPGPPRKPAVAETAPQPTRVTDDTSPGPRTAASPPSTSAKPLPRSVRGREEGASGLTPGAPPSKTLELQASDYLTLRMDAQAGGIVGVQLRKYDSDADPAKPYTLGDPRFPLCSLVLRNGEPIAGNGRVVRKSDREAVLTRTIPGSSVELEEAWRVSDSTPYQVDYSVTLKNGGDKEYVCPPLYVTGGAVSLPDPKDKKSGGRFAMYSLGVNVLFKDQKKPVTFSIKKIGKFENKDLKALAKSPLQWTALHNKYFLFCVSMPPGAKSLPGLWVKQWPATEDAKGALTAAIPVDGVRLTSGQTITHKLSVYAGPKELKRLHAWRPGLESVMGLNRFFLWHPAWMGWLSSLILRSLIGLNGVFDHKWGYGWAIIVVTFVIKMLFWPLTHRSTVSMRRMQKIQPQMKEIREKYKSNPKKMNEKIMELYREHNVSPLGGCLPIFFQIPVFFSLFNTLRGAIELRHAGFLWAKDLSIPDDLPFGFAGFPIRPFAILMVVTMLLQQKLMPTSADPSQTRMMLFMTVFMAFIFYGMPSGLTLYWTFNQVLTIAQTLVTKKLEERAAGAPAAA